MNRGAMRREWYRGQERQRKTLQHVFLLLLLFLFPLLTHACVPTGRWWVCGLNAALMALTSSFAVWYPSIQAVLRFTGALGGFINIFILPIVVYWVLLKKEGKLTVWR
jgi:hypothetical protein